MQDPTVYKNLSSSCQCSQQPCPHGQLYVDEATPGFGISKFVKTCEMESFTPWEISQESYPVLVICPSPQVSMGAPLKWEWKKTIMRRKEDVEEN